MHSCFLLIFSPQGETCALQLAGPRVAPGMSAFFMADHPGFKKNWRIIFTRDAMNDEIF